MSMRERANARPLDPPREKSIASQGTYASTGIAGLDNVLMGGLIKAGFYLIQGDPGAGKTIMTGLLVKELIIRGDVAKCLIVAPGSLVEQWQDELDQKFNLHFDILTNEGLQAARTGGPRRGTGDDPAQAWPGVAQHHRVWPRRVGPGGLRRRRGSSGRTGRLVLRRHC